MCVLLGVGGGRGQTVTARPVGKVGAGREGEQDVHQGMMWG